VGDEHPMARLFESAERGLRMWLTEGDLQRPCYNICRTALSQIGWKPPEKGLAELCYLQLDHTPESAALLAEALKSRPPEGFFFWNWTNTGWSEITSSRPLLPQMSDSAIVTIEYGANVSWLSVPSRLTDALSRIL